MTENSGIEVTVDGHLIRPNFQEGESLAGYLLRFAQSNRLFGLRGLANTHGMSPQQLLFADRGELVRKLWGPQWASRSDLALFQGAPQPLLGADSAPTRVCPVCIRDAKVKISRAAWDRPMSLVCGKHGVMLRDKCQKCGEQLDYLTRRFVEVCRCGADLTAQPAEAVDDSVACIEWVYSAASPAADAQEQADEAAARSIIRMAAHLKGGPELASTKVRASEPFVTTDVLKGVAPWFQAWPDGFVQSLAKVGWRASALRSAQRRVYLRAERFPRIDDAFDVALRSSRVEREITGTARQATTLKFPLALIRSLRARAAQARPTVVARGRQFKRSRASGSAPATADSSRPEPANSDGGWPSGGLPVLLLAFLATQAESTDSTVIGVDRASLREIFDPLGVNLSSGGKMAPFARVQTALQSMGTASLHWGTEFLASSTGESGRTLPRRLFSDSTSREGRLTTVVLSQWFLEECKNNSIDLSIEALRTIKGSPIALSLYLTLCERAASGQHAGCIPWVELGECIGSMSQRQRKVKETIKQAIPSFDTACPNASIGMEPVGLRYKLAPSFASLGR